MHLDLRFSASPFWSILKIRKKEKISLTFKMGIIMVSSSYSDFSLWATQSFTSSNLTWKSQCGEGKI